MNISSLAASPAAQLQAQVQQLKTQNPQAFQAMLTQVTGQLNQTSGVGHSGAGHCSGTRSQTLAGKLFGSVIPPQSALA